jgi:hypothetical protein
VATSGEFIRRCESRAGVAHLQVEHSVLSPGAYLDQARAGACGDTVADGVLDERLEDQGRYLRGKSLGRDVGLHSKPIAEPMSFDFQVAPSKAELVLQRKFLRIPKLQRAAQQVGHVCDQVHRLIDEPLADMNGNSMQGVEKKVRMQLHPQYSQLSLCEPGLKPCCLDLPTPKALMTLEYVNCGDNHAVQ